MKKTLAPKTKKLIEEYQNLPLGNGGVRCPYFINVLGVRAGVKVFLGKGSPKEIVEETELLAGKNKIDLSKLSADKIREFMKKHNLGADCSGLVANIFHAWDPDIIRNIKVGKTKGLLRSVIARFRRLENISVSVLTGSENSFRLEDWRTVNPGDMIKTRGGKHILLVTDVVNGESGELQEFHYVHSTSKYGETSGVREGIVKVTDRESRLEDQDWQELDGTTERNFTYEGLMEGEGNGVYRLRYFG